MKKILAAFLALCLLFALAACTGTGDPADSTDNNTQDTGTQDTADDTQDTVDPGCENDPSVYDPGLPQVTVDNPVTFMTISYTDAEGNVCSLNAWDNDEGQAYVEYVGQEKKVGTFPLSVLHNITQAIAESGFAELNGQSVYQEGTSYASMYVLYQDETYLGADYTGHVSQEYLDAYGKLDSFFQQLTAKLPVYVPQPIVMGEVNADVLAAMKEILNNTGISDLDMMYISDVPRDEFFDITVGMTDTSQVTSGTTCSHMMMTSAYSFVIVTVSEDANVEAIREDLANHLQWNKWVCVSATDAMIAQKDNMILCLMGADAMYSRTASAIEDSGWTDIETYRKTIKYAPGPS